MNWINENLDYIIIGLVTIATFCITFYLARPKPIEEDEHERGIW